MKHEIRITVETEYSASELVDYLITPGLVDLGIGEIKDASVILGDIED